MQHEGAIPPNDHRRSSTLCRVIAEQVRADGGALSFEQFMQLALYEPGLGYYMAPSDKFGADGDFVTAPGLTPLFGRAIAAQLADLLAQHPDMRVLEYGAGDGQLAVAVLAELEGLACLPAGYDIIEQSPWLRAQQRQLLSAHHPHLLDRVQWLGHSPSGYRGAIIANELLDALPVIRLVKSRAGYQEQVIEVDGDNLALGYRQTNDPRIRQRLDDLGLADGYQTEINFRAEAWVEALSEVLEEGLILLLDYGYCRAEYYHPQRDVGTFLCYFRHTAADNPLHCPGLQDMTAHIDFTAMAEAATCGGLQVAGFTTQANFLISCGILDQLAGQSEDDGYLDALAPVKQLLLPGGMGEVFKVMALTRGFSEPLKGMTPRDLRHTL